MKFDLPEIDACRKLELNGFQKSCGIRFKNIRLLNLAFMHRSVSNEPFMRGEGKQNNERLEFLGDSILGAVTATLLYSGQPGHNEGELAKIKSNVVSTETLAGIARELQVDSYLILGHGEELSGGRTKKALLADALEAIFGALYIDSGYKAAFQFIERCISPEIARVQEKRGLQDYKSAFQEECQKRFHVYPRYKLIKRTGPEHEHYFWIEVLVEGRVLGQGTGKNKKTAEQEAARAALGSFSVLN
ncbi:MAG: ribonuclease III [Spirochaetaceae bacterium]|jgi:ribonuclease-3|nr:ribonuclease III [Spirochaetaceae bacterium]